MAQDLYARRLNATTAFFRAADNLLEPSYREKIEMDIAAKKELMDSDLDFYIKKNNISNQSALEQLRRRNEMEFEQFRKMEDEKYNRQVEMYKDGQLLALQMIHESNVAQYAYTTQKSLLEAEEKESATKRVTETPGVEASLLPGDITPKDTLGLFPRIKGTRFLGLTVDASTVLATGDELITSLEPTIKDLELASETTNLKSNYLYKRALETVDSALRNIGADKIDRRFRRFKTNEQYNNLQLQVRKLQQYKDSLLDMVE